MKSEVILRKLRGRGKDWSIGTSSERGYLFWKGDLIAWRCGDVMETTRVKPSRMREVSWRHFKYRVLVSMRGRILRINSAWTTWLVWDYGLDMTTPELELEGDDGTRFVLLPDPLDARMDQVRIGCDTPVRLVWLERPTEEAYRDLLATMSKTDSTRVALHEHPLLRHERDISVPLRHGSLEITTGRGKNTITLRWRGRVYAFGRISAVRLNMLWVIRSGGVLRDVWDRHPARIHAAYCALREALKEVPEEVMLEIALVSNWKS